MAYPNHFTVAAEGIAVMIYTVFITSLTFLFFGIPVFIFEAVKHFAFNNNNNTSTNAPKTVLITGGSAGIGQALAQKYTEKGSHNVYVTGRDAKGLQETIDLCKKINNKVNVVGIKVDVTQKEAMIAELQKYDDLTPIDVVIANAGISPEQQQHKPQEAIYRDTFDVNINGVLNTIFPLYERFVTRKSGHFVLISSIASFGNIAHPAYSSSKSLITTLGQGLRRDLQPHGVKVTTICPGFIKSRITIERHESRPGGLPFFQEQEPSADKMYHAIQENIGVFVFPVQLHVAAWLLRFLPFYVQDFVALHLAKIAYRGGNGVKSSTDIVIPEKKNDNIDDKNTAAVVQKEANKLD